MFKKIIILMIAVFAVMSNVSAGFEDGLRAYNGEKYEEAFVEWKQAAESGDYAAMRNIAHLYRWGKGVKKDLTKSVYWYQKAANGGFSRAQYNLAMMYVRGDGVVKNNEKAIYWLELASKSGYMAAETELKKIRLKEKKEPVKIYSEKKYYAHLGSYRNLKNLNNGWGVFSKKYTKLAEFETYNKKVDLGEKGRYIRLYVVGEKEELVTLCKNLKPQYCIVYDENFKRLKK
jgi:TPR repeat protein